MTANICARSGRAHGALARGIFLCGLAAVLVAPPAGAQVLTLDEAIAAAIGANPEIAAGVAGLAAAREAQVTARAARLPALEVQESWTRGTHPVFAFSSLLAQGRLAESSLALFRLNNPDALSNYRLGVMLRQPVFDGGSRRADLQAAETAGALASAELRKRTVDVVAGVTRVFADAAVAGARARSALAGIEAALEDLASTRAHYDEGQATEADTLALEVHLATMRSLALEAEGDRRVAVAALNRLMHVPLDRAWTLVEPPPRADDRPDVTALEAEAVAGHAEVAAARLRTEGALAAEARARAARLPRVAAEGGMEWNGGTWTDRRSSWVAGVRAEWSLSLGGGERATARAATYGVDRARAELDAAESAARLEVRTTVARVETARARAGVSGAAVLHAREAARIVRDRYDAGLAGVTDLLRATSALVEAESREAGARGSLLQAAAQLDQALGRLPARAPDVRTP